MDTDASMVLPTRPYKRKGAEPDSQTPKKAKPLPSPPSGQSSAASSPGSPIEAETSPRTPLSTNGTRAKKLICPWDACDKSFSRPVHLQEHLNAHRGERPHRCPHQGCPKAFFRRSHLDHHVRSAHTDERKWACSQPGCGRAFSTGTRLRRHEASVHASSSASTGTNVSRFPCPTCGQVLRKHATLQRHVATAHEGRAAFVCEKVLQATGAVCGAGFATAGKLRAHEGRVHGVPRYECTACEVGQTFSTYAAFAAHNRDEHPPQCTHCEFEARSQRDLRSHLERVHDVVVAPEHMPARPAQALVCDRPGCDKSFSKRANLTAHVKTAHEGVRFMCDAAARKELKRVGSWDGSGACGKAFTSKASLEEHVRTAHLGVKSERRAKKERQDRQGERRVEPDVLDVLTGAAFDNDQRRKLPCLVPGCAWRFVREYDRAVHARARHGLGDEDVRFLTAVAEHDKPADDGESPDKDQMDVEEEDEDEDEDEEWEDRFDQEAQHGGEFWIGGADHVDGVDDWDMVQQDMWRLVDDEDENIEPMLRS